MTLPPARPSERFLSVVTGEGSCPAVATSFNVTVVHAPASINTREQLGLFETPGCRPGPRAYSRVRARAFSPERGLLEPVKPKVYQYPKCSTCRKALTFFERHGVEIDSKDIVVTPPTKAELARALKLSGLPIKKLFNTSGQSYREGGFGERLPAMTESQALDALAKDGKLIKRPLVLGSDYALVGYDEASYRKRFG
jgi:arsenate reductase